ncbi:1,4-dihydroxy-2-naphthoate prenyltransferase [Microcella putealis]|uniref:1,4-dihydroxy-2-naphthoate octaprenyltransferase n=1 Tax=Microcella putealis TaxID=337005 RepID=A0A4Q7LNM3_9MICO|nr:1,4-dihydroxy-2-naphthoate polyprenyltransferase [Microcella putealis]RZS55159.1 1,4-dihydroxy-2-naphthoate prenyltransferase [Microcella putealis]TQM23579.1 1,4-dihydroxy-2-naphthoate prenyltransferase [Microcella putealis]
MAKTPAKKKSGTPARNARAQKKPHASPERSGNPAAVRRATPRDWIAGARPRTLTLALAPVILGTAVAYWFAAFDPTLAGLALAVAVFLQVGVNYANDYSDGVRGTDAVRVGPSRLTGSGAAKPRTVLTVALVFFALAAAAGLAIVVLTQLWWLIAVGAVALVAAWFYTGGKRPYGYAGLGELVAFVFFGPVAVVGTTFIQTGTAPFESWLAGVMIGLFAAAILLVNNIRDVEQDTLAGKRTLAVRTGSRVARILFVVLLALPFVGLVWFIILFPAAPLAFFALLLTLPVSLIVITARTPRELILALQLTSLAALVFAVALGAAIAF